MSYLSLEINFLSILRTRNTTQVIFRSNGIFSSLKIARIEARSQNESKQNNDRKTSKINIGELLSFG